MSPDIRQTSVPPQPDPVDPQRLEQRFAQRLDELRASLSSIDAERIAELSGARYKSAGELHFSMWDRPVRIVCGEWLAYPIGEDQPLTAFDQALLLYYLATADGTPLHGEWIAFSELPDGRFYNQAFQGYTGMELARAFKDDQPAFEQAAQSLGGVRHSLGHASFVFQALPRAPILAIYWQGDEDFASTCQLLFDAAASHYLPTDAYAILGSTLTRKLIKARR